MGRIGVELARLSGTLQRHPFCAFDVSTQKQLIVDALVVIARQIPLTKPPSPSNPTLKVPGFPQGFKSSHTSSSPPTAR
jgi:hypothetical protein